jgi:hypothetical protein
MLLSFVVLAAISRLPAAMSTTDTAAAVPALVAAIATLRRRFSFFPLRYGHTLASVSRVPARHFGGNFAIFSVLYFS